MTTRSSAFITNVYLMYIRAHLNECRKNFQKTKAITTANQNKEKYHEEQRRTHSENKPLDKPLEARVNASDQVLISFNLIGK